jgi:hypothetical protein
MARANHLVVSLVALTAALAGTVAGLGPAHAANELERSFWLKGPGYSGNPPPCESVLEEIAGRFVAKETRFWNSKLFIVNFRDVREIALRPWQPSSIPRRYCTAHVVLSDDTVRTMNFSVIEDGALASMGQGVEFCVIGLDRNWAFNPACKMAMP